MLSNGSLHPPKNEQETVKINKDNLMVGSFVYSRSKELDMKFMEKVHEIALDAKKNTKNLCKILNGIFNGEASPSQEKGSNIHAYSLISTNVHLVHNAYYISRTTHYLKVCLIVNIATSLPKNNKFILMIPNKAVYNCA